MNTLLVTGGCGFIGSHFVRHWLARFPGGRLINLDKLTYAGNPENLRDVERHPKYTFVHGDITDRSAVDRVMAEADLVINFAAESHVDRSITDATPFLQTNAIGVSVLLESARAHRIQRFLHVSTDEVYGSIPEGEAAEDAPLHPNSPYAASKAAGDLLALAYHTTYQLPVVVTRGSNTYGPNQYPEKVMPLFITNLIEGESVPIYGDGLQRRDWLYVQDHVEALELVLLRGEPGSAYNISGAQELTNRELTTKILAAMGAGEERIAWVQDRPGHDRRYAIDGGRLARLGWRPRVTFDQGLRETVAWYRAQETWWKPLKERLRADPYHWLNRAAGSGPARATPSRA